VIPCADYHRERFMAVLPWWQDVARSKVVGRIVVSCHGWRPEHPDALGNVDAVISNGRGWASSATRNAPLPHLEEDIVLFCDADVVMYPSLVRSHYYAHKEHIGEAPLLVANLHKNIVWPDGGVGREESLEHHVSPDIWRAATHDWRRPVLEECDWLKRAPAQPLWSLGGGSGISLRRDWLLQVGAWHPGFEAWGYEDNELWYRLGKSGFRFHFLDEYAYHIQHEVNIPERLDQANANAALFKAERDNCAVTYIVDAVTSDHADLVIDSDYQVEVIGSYPLNAASPFGIRAVPLPIRAPADAFRPFARGWYVCDLRPHGNEVDPTEYLSMRHCGSQIVSTGSNVYTPRSSSGYVVHRVSGGRTDAGSSAD